MKFYRFMRALVSPFVRVIFPTKIIGIENMPKDKALVIANHYSACEVFPVGVKLFKKEFHAMAKKELFKCKPFNPILRKLGGIPVDRDGADTSAMKTVIKLLSSGKQVYMCPEGTRNKVLDGKMLPIKTGAAVFAVKTKTKLVPILFNTKIKIFRKTYVIIGEPYELDAFYGDRTPDMKERATAVIEQKFSELRVKLDEYVQSVKSKKVRK